MSSPLPPQLCAALLEAFHLFDADRDGRLSFTELPTALRSVGFILTIAQLRAVTKALLPTHLGFLTPADLLRVAASLPRGAEGFNPRTPEHSLAYLREQLAQGVLAQANQAQLLCCTGEGLSAKEYAAMSALMSRSLRYGFLPPLAPQAL